MTKANKKLSAEDLLLDQGRAIARKNLLGFTIWTKPDFRVNWHHRILAKKLDKWVNREIRNIMVFMPPRLGKTELVSRRLPAYIFGKDPKAKIIAASYSADLAQANNRDVQFIIDSAEYRELFPETCLSGDNVRTVAAGSYLRNSDIFETVPFRGTYRSAGVGGGITGMGGDYIIIDDPIKNADEAESQTFRDRLFDWYRTTLYTRREKGAGICLVMTRWHDDDLAGRLLQEAESDPESDQWEIIKFPMLSEEERITRDPRTAPGQALWPWKYDEAECRRIRKAVGSRAWLALYQQRPSHEKGNIIQKTWWKWYDKRPEHFQNVMISVDASFKGTDTSSYVSIQAWCKNGPDAYFLDQIRDQMGFLDTIKAIQSMRQKWPAIGVLIEDKANGPAIIETLKQKIPGIIPSMPYGSKVARLSAASPWVEAGNVYLPKPEIFPKIIEFVEEVGLFPNAKNSDQVDAFSQIIHYYQENSGSFEAFVTL